MDCYSCGVNTEHEVEDGPICVNCLLEEFKDLRRGYKVLKNIIKELRLEKEKYNWATYKDR